MANAKTKTKATTTTGTPKAATKVKGEGTRAKPWTLPTPSGQSEFQAFRDDALDPPALVVMVGKTELRYHLRCLDDLHAMLEKHGDWMLLGNADEQKPAAAGTVEAWARSPKNPVGGFYGLKKRPSRAFRQLRAARDEAARPRRGREQPEEQPDARHLRSALRRGATT
jgi:hypothetical protein